MDADATIKEKVLYLLQVEKLSGRQIACHLKIGYRRLKRLLMGEAVAVKRFVALETYRQLIAEWYRQYPKLQASQVWRRLKNYGYQGSVSSVERFTRPLRVKNPQAYHALDFVPGEEAQVDWFFAKLENIGPVILFLYVLSWSRYAFGRFYPRSSFEFFLSGHLECFRHLNGLAHTHRYDNLKSVVLRHTPDRVDYNPNFLEFARHYGFKIHACNPYKGNEKGRVERLGRDVRASFLYGQTFKDMDDLNRRFVLWLAERNATVCRSTGKPPLDLLPQEKLLGLPCVEFIPVRIVPAVCGKTALVEFETNRYSVPSTLCLKPCQVLAYPDRIEIRVGSDTVARHKRSFDRHKTFQNPLHLETLLGRSPLFKYQRILRVIESMEPSFKEFLKGQEDDQERLHASYQIFKLLKTHNRALLVSAVRELLSMGVFKTKAFLSLLNLPESKEGRDVLPNNKGLLDIQYKERSLEEYDPPA